MHLSTDPEHWNYNNYFASVLQEHLLLRTAQMGVHHRLLLRMDRYLVSLQDSCFGEHLLTGPLGMETVKTSIRLFSNSFHTMIISVYI